MYPLSICMPSTYSVSKLMPRDSSTVITPSLPTLSITSAINCPIASSAAEMEATWAISFLPSTGIASERMYSTTASVPLSMPCLSCMGLAPAARFFKPSVTIAWASTVAVVVPSPATSLVRVAASLSSCAPMFSKGFSSEISLATVTPSWVTVGDPNFLSSATLRPLGPSVDLTASAKISIPFLRERRASSSNTSCFAIIGIPSFRIDQSTLADDGQDVIFPEHQVLIVFQNELGAAILGVQDAIALADIHGGALASIKHAASTYSDHDALLRLLFSSVRDNDATLGDFFFSNRFNDHAVAHRTDVCHDVFSFFQSLLR